ncbi:MAG: M1 family metallopeptidase [Bacteroidetes bacterium]|nr:M1 family metallopeptidase [Bacteroidota bacterium]
MKQNKFLIATLLISIFFLGNVYSQEYFQQKVNYTINVKLNDVKNELFANETIEYTNNSPKALNFLYFHLWPNAYKNENTAFAKQNLENGSTWFYFSDESEKGYIDSIDFKVNKKRVKWKLDSVNIDICKLHLNKPIKPGETIIITTPFHVKIPITFSRLGHSKQSYQISQWYPKPAVYDKYGWHQMPYLDQGEFYSEFGDFDVSITVPRNYLVAATGNLMNDDEKICLDQKVKETEQIKKFDEKNQTYPASDSITKTLRFTEKNIHDFAWFADKRYHVLKSKVTLPNSKHTVNTWVYFLNYDAKKWVNALEYVNDAIKYYSSWYGEYPYNNCTAVLGALTAGGGMEYPTITIIGNSQNKFILEVTIMHEVGHNWFYGMLGFNEREYAWMDEGINSFSEVRYINAKYPNNRAYQLITNGKVAKFLGIQNEKYKYFHELSYLISARYNVDQSSSLSSENYSSYNYGVNTYYKPAFSIDYLKNYLGEDKFNDIMQKFFKQWQYKHPYPQDIKKCFNDNCDKNLDWFFKDILISTKKIDYKVKSIKNNELTVKNSGKINSPINISEINNDTVVYSQWYDGFEGEKKFKINSADADKIVIDYSKNMLDVNRKNNTIRTYGILKKVEPLKFKILGIVENTNKTQINYFPLMGWNNYDKFMLGVLFTNSILPKQKFDYIINPFYSFEKNNIAGTGQLSYTIFTNSSFIKNITIGSSITQYSFGNESDADYQRYEAKAKINFRKANPRSSINNSVTINSILASDLEDYYYNNKTVNKYFHNIKYDLKNTRKINPYNVSLNIQAAKGFVKSWLEANYKITYNRVRKGLNIRFFAGKFLYNSDSYYGNYNFRLSGTTGYQDYTFDNIFLGRMETLNNDADNHLLSQQFVRNDGGFTTYTYLGQTNNWLTTLNLSSSLPAKIPFKVYANIGTYNNIKDYSKSKQFIYEAGVEFPFFNNTFVIYVPIVMSEDLKETSDFVTDNYWQKIRFTLNLNKLYQLKNASSFIF